MMTNVLLLLAMVIVIGYFWRARNNAARKEVLLKSAGKPLNTKTVHPSHRCVAIETGLLPCRAILAYQEKRILMHEAPSLPVQGCDAKKCECRFLRYDDRRAGPRRSNLKTANQIVAESNNSQRSKRDRRSS